MGKKQRDRDLEVATIVSSRNQDSEVEGDSNGDLQIASPGNSEAQQALVQFWPKVTEEIKKITTVSISHATIQ